MMEQSTRQMCVKRKLREASVDPDFVVYSFPLSFYSKLGINGLITTALFLYLNALLETSWL